MRTASGQRRAGLTLIELAIVVTLIGMLTMVAMPRIAVLTARLSLRAASDDVRTALAIGRSLAVRRGEYVAFVGDAAHGRIRIVSGVDTLFTRDLAPHGVTLTLTRDSITWAPNGQGWGAANTTITLARRGGADTITVSRLGRVR